MSMNVGINGICGRMGEAVAEIILGNGDTIGAAFDLEGESFFGKSVDSFIPEAGDALVHSLNEIDIKKVDGVIDFTAPGATMSLLEMAVKTNTRVVIGTTGFSEAQKNKIAQAAQEIPVLFSPNMSVGVNMLFKLTELAAKSLQSGYDVEVFEAHHRFKKDAPSGTAKKLVEIIKENNPSLADAEESHNRNGIIGERKDNEIGIMTMRGGDIVGEHTVYFNGFGERIEITHRASSRSILAKGAVMGMEFLLKQSPGLYSMYDVLGL